MTRIIIAITFCLICFSGFSKSTHPVLKFYNTDTLQTILAADIDSITFDTENYTEHIWYSDGIISSTPINVNDSIVFDKTPSIVGIWTCTQTTSSGNVEIYTVELKEDGSAEIPSMDMFEGARWGYNSDGELGIQVILYVSSNYSLTEEWKCVIENRLNPIKFTGSITRWSCNSVGSFASYPGDVILIKNE